MSNIKRGVEEYLKLRRKLGFECKRSGALLVTFASFMKRKNATVISRELAIQFAKEPKDALPSTWVSRLSVLRGFAGYWCGIDPRTETLPHGLLPFRYRRKDPYIYKTTEIARLLKVAQDLPPKDGLRRHTYYTLFGVLAVTGIRISEVIALNREDVDLVRGILAIRRTKSRKSRLVPIHRSTVQELETYSRLRVESKLDSKAPSFFVSSKGTRLTQDIVRWTFVQLSRKIGLRQPSKSHGHGPRIHDIRHNFVIQAMIRWYRSGLDVDQNIHLLSTFVGHDHPSDTYWYISAVPELMGLARTRLEKQMGGLS